MVIANESLIIALLYVLNFVGSLYIVNHFYLKPQIATLTFVLIYWIWYKLYFDINTRVQDTVHSYFHQIIVLSDKL